MNLHMVICQNDREFVHMLIRFRRTSYTQLNVNSLQNTCLQTPPAISKIPHLFYINKTCSHNDLVFQKTIVQTFIIKAISILHHLVPFTYHLPNDPNKTT
jgi:hypothetical protein